MKEINGRLGFWMAVALLAFLMAEVGVAAQAEPATFSSITIEVDDEQGVVTIEENGESRDFRFLVANVTTPEGQLVLSGDLVITEEGMLAGGVLYPLEELRVDETYLDDGNLIGIVLNYRKSSDAARRRSVSRNRIGVARRLTVEYEDFVRGDVVCFGGNVEISGEVNRNVVALFGDVIIKTDGIVRRDVVAVDGKIYLRGEALVYGETLAHHGCKKSSKARTVFRFDDGDPHHFQLDGGYNRVDGLRLGAKYRLADPDSILPSVHVSGGYSFEAERWNYDVGVHQRVFRDYSFALGGSFFRQTSTDDHWLSPEWEQFALSILAAEDPLDYYEEEGGKVYLTFNPGYFNEFGVSYGFTELSWMDHHPKLWSLFGWDKEFRANFSSVPAAERLGSRHEFESKLGQLTAWYNLDTRDDVEETYSGWWANLEYQTAGAKLKGDLAFDRLTAEVRRYQPITYRQNINLRVKYGTSGRDLPLFREFYLGGMRTVRGIDHKSLRGEQMILGNVEYILYFPPHSIETALLFDIGKVVGKDDDIFSDGDYETSAGVRFGLERGLNIEISKSLTGTEDSFKLWVLFQRSF